MKHISIVFCFLFLSGGCGATTGNEGVKKTPTLEAHSKAALPVEKKSDEVTLFPKPPGQYLRWGLSNENRDVILVSSPLAISACGGHFEHRSYRDRWVWMPTRSCSVCSGYDVPPLKTVRLGASDDVVLPAGFYRYVTSFEPIPDESRERQTEPKKIISVEFTIPGYREKEVAKINELLGDVEKQNCPDVLNWVIGGAGHFTDPAALPQLLHAHVDQLSTHKKLVETVFRVADYQEIAVKLLDGQYGTTFSLAAALVFAESRCSEYACGWEATDCSAALCQRAVNNLAGLFVPEGEHLPDIAVALSEYSDSWPDGLIDRFIEFLASTSSPELREALFFDVLVENALLDAVEDKIGKRKKNIIRALKRALRNETRPETKKEMRRTIRKFEREGVIGYLAAARAPVQWPDWFDETEQSDHCRSVFKDVETQLLFPSPNIPPVDIMPSIIEPYDNVGVPFRNMQDLTPAVDQPTN